MSPPSCRTLVQALAVSLLLHAVFLSSAVSWFPARLEVPATSLLAVISDRRAAVPAPSASPARSPSAAPKPSAPTPGTRELVAVPTAAVVPAETPPRVGPREAIPPVSSEAAGHLPLSPASGAAALPSPASNATPGVTPGAASNAPAGTASAVGRSAISGDDLRQYRLSLAGAARRFKQYPAQARQRGWEGTVEVALKMSAPSPVPEVSLVSSSGHGVLDEQAVAMLTQAAHVTALPEGLKARDFRLLLPVQFSLESDQ